MAWGCFWLCKISAVVSRGSRDVETTTAMTVKAHGSVFESLLVTNGLLECGTAWISVLLGCRECSLLNRQCVNCRGVQSNVKQAVLCPRRVESRSCLPSLVWDVGCYLKTSWIFPTVAGRRFSNGFEAALLGAGPILLSRTCVQMNAHSFGLQFAAYFSTIFI